MVGSRSIFCFNPEGFVGSVPEREQLIPDSVRSGATTFPESGIEVSRYVNFLSREKRKMWLQNFHSVYL